MTQSEKPSPSDYQRRLLSVTAPVTVTLAECKQSLGNLLSLVPGEILLLETRCDQPLRLSIGGQPIGAVEPVKVGDKFGVRIREMLVSKPASN